MFNVKCLNQSSANQKPIVSGVTFGFYNIPLIFEVRAEIISVPLTVKFITTNNVDKSYEFDLGEIRSNERIIQFNIPKKGASGGLTEPAVIAYTATHLLVLMFVVDSFGEGPCYKLSYEFYERIREDKKREDLQ